MGGESHAAIDTQPEFDFVTLTTHARVLHMCIEVTLPFLIKQVE